MKPRFRAAVLFIMKHEQGFIEKDLLGLCLHDSMFFTFSCIARIPVEAFYFLKVYHFLYIIIIYFQWSTSSGKSHGSRLTRPSASTSGRLEATARMTRAGGPIRRRKKAFPRPTPIRVWVTVSISSRRQRDGQGGHRGFALRVFPEPVMIPMP